MDEIDRKILTELQANGRLANAELAARVGLSASPCLRRLRILERSGAIAGYTSIIAPNALGLALAAFAQVTLERGDETIDQVFLASLAQISAVSGWYACAGDYDYFLKIVARDLDEYYLALFSLRRLKCVALIKAGIAIDPKPEMFAFHRISYAKSQGPDFRISAFQLPEFEVAGTFDSFDRRIIRHMQQNARISVQKLSERVCLSPPATLQRLRRLESNQTILGYTAIIQPRAIGLGIVSLIGVTVAKAPEHSTAFEEAMLHRPEVAACFAVAGDVDYEVRVVTPDIRSYASFLKNYLRRLPSVVTVNSALCIDPPPHLFSQYALIKGPLQRSRKSRYDP